MPKLNETIIEYYDEFQRARLRGLQAVDEMLVTLVQKLDEHDLLVDTYTIFATDNEYHDAQHRVHLGKECPYEIDIQVPLVVRGPGVPAGHTAGSLSSHADLASTTLRIAGVDRPDLDDSPIPLNKPFHSTRAHWWNHYPENMSMSTSMGRAILEGIYSHPASLDI